MFAQRTTLDPLPGPIRDRMRVVTVRKPSADDRDARLPAMIADLIRNAVTRAGCRCSMARAIGSAAGRRLRIVETLLRERDVRATRN